MYVELNGHLVYVHNGGNCEIYPFDPFFQAVAKLAGRFHAVTLQVDASLGWDSFGWQKRLFLSYPVILYKFQHSNSMMMLLSQNEVVSSLEEQSLVTVLPVLL